MSEPEMNEPEMKAPEINGPDTSDPDMNDPVVGQSAAGVTVEAGAAGAESIGSRVGKDIVAAMKSKDEHRLTTLRMVKSALKNKEIELRHPLTDADEMQILTTLIKQRKESVESFTKGGRPELAEKEGLEVTMIEGYLPQAAGEDEIRQVVHGAIVHLSKDGARPTMKDMGVTMGVVKQRLFAAGLRADGKVVSDMVRAELARS